MTADTPAEKRMTLEEKRTLYRCKMYHVQCSNCTMFRPTKAVKRDKT